MLGPNTGLHVFWSNPLVGTITTLALVMLFWPLVPFTWRMVKRMRGQGNDSGDTHQGINIDAKGLK
jgi:putative tricarboxylic transport membrane protein